MLYSCRKSQLAPFLQRDFSQCLQIRLVWAAVGWGAGVLGRWGKECSVARNGVNVKRGVEGGGGVVVVVVVVVMVWGLIGG